MRACRQGVNPVLGPDATSVGWVFQYALVDRSGQHDLAELRTFQDFHLRYALASVPGVAEVASVGGYQNASTRSRSTRRGCTPTGSRSPTCHRAIRRSNCDVGGRVIEMSGREYFVRGRGYVTQPRRPARRSRVGVDRRTGTPIRVSRRGTVSLRPRHPPRRARAGRRGRGGGRHRRDALRRERAARDRAREAASSRS